MLAQVDMEITEALVDQVEETPMHQKVATLEFLVKETPEVTAEMVLLTAEAEAVEKELLEKTGKLTEVEMVELDLAATVHGCPQSH